jgi:hypothetical protein
MYGRRYEEAIIFSLPGGPVVTELRTHEQGLVGGVYGTNPTHEPTENRCCRYGNQRRA